jgi:hypothetical protein
MLVLTCALSKTIVLVCPWTLSRRVAVRFGVLRGMKELSPRPHRQHRDLRDDNSHRQTWR